MDNLSPPQQLLKTCYQVPPIMSSDGETMIAQVVFTEDFPLFTGHFPGDPILPGFMHIELARDMLRHLKLPSTLKTIDNAKFISPIRPGQKINVSMAKVNGRIAVEIQADGELCSTMELTFI